MLSRFIELARFRPVSSIKPIKGLVNNQPTLNALAALYVRRGIATTASQEVLLSAYQQHIKPVDRVCLTSLEERWSKDQPFKGKTILVNAHITLITLTMLRVLSKAGANVEVTASMGLAQHDNAMQALRQTQIPFLPQVPSHKQHGYYDIVYDCGAGMRDVIPKVGMAELTHTDPSIYKDCRFPVITVDNSKTKRLEAAFGTGNSLVRVINELSRRAIVANLMNFSYAYSSLGGNDPEYTAIKIKGVETFSWE